MLRSKLLALVLGLTCLTTNANDQELTCLAKNVYFEARGESYKGKMAVAKVTMNRVSSGLFPNTVCGVVYQPKQFSWVKGKKAITDKAAWQESLDVATSALAGEYGPLVGFKALYFHNAKVKPTWGKRLIATIGGHKFYG